MHSQDISSRSCQHGLVALSFVLILSAVLTAISITVTFLSIGEAQSSFALFKGEDVLSFVEGCVEDALLKAKNDPLYNGGVIIRPEGSCLITVVSKVGALWTLDVTNTPLPPYNFKRTIRITFTRGANGVALANQGWQEI